MAETYSMAVHTMGFGSLLCLLSAEAWSLYNNGWGVRDPAIIVAVVLTASLFVAALITSDVNLKTATRSCVAAMPSGYSPRVKVLRPYEIWRVFQEPYRSR
jgi:phosphoketolase